MILKRVLEQLILLKHGCTSIDLEIVLLITINVVVQLLYKNGLIQMLTLCGIELILTALNFRCCEIELLLVLKERLSVLDKREYLVCLPLDLAL